MEEKALIAVEKLDVAVVFSESGMIKLLEEIETKAISHVPDITSEQGRKDIASLAYKVTRSKTLIDDLGKEVVSDWKKKAKTIDGHRKIARDFLDNLKDKVRQPLTEWEAAEAIIKKEEDAIEKEKINKKITALFSVGVNLPFFDVAMLSDAEYFTMFATAKAKHDAEQLRIAKEESARKVEAKRLEKIAEEQKAEAERLKKVQEAQEAETRKKLATQEAKLEGIRIEQEKAAKVIADREKALKAKEQAIEDAKRKEQDRLDKIVLEEQAKIQATKDVEAKIEREKKEEAERLVAKEIEKKRQAEIAPDQEKLIDLAMTIRQIISPPAIKNETAKEIVETILVALSVIADNLEEQSEEL